MVIDEETVADAYRTLYQMVQRYNCGTSMFGLLPAVLFFVFAWRLSDTYVSTFVHLAPEQLAGRARRRHRDRRAGSRRWRWLLYLTKKALTFILVWSSGQLWSEGLLRCLDAYTLRLLTEVNCCLIPIPEKWKLDQNTIAALEPFAKFTVCSWVVMSLRTAYLLVEQHSRFERRLDNLRRQRERLQRIYNNWQAQTREFDELGEDGHLLTQNIFPPETDPGNGRIAGAKKPRLTRSCILFPVTKDASGSATKTVQRRRSI